MRKVEKLNLLLVIVLGVSLVYLGVQVENLQRDVRELDSRIVEAEIVIDNGSARTSEEVQVLKGETALKALEKVATVETKTYPGAGEMITSINNLENNRTRGTYWLIAYRNETEKKWRASSQGAGRIKLGDGQEILFWYGKSSEAPFELSL